MQGITKKLVLATTLAGLSVFAPVGLDSANRITITNACADGSCAPHCEWECHQPGEIRYDKWVVGQFGQSRRKQGDTG